MSSAILSLDPSGHGKDRGVDFILWSTSCTSHQQVRGEDQADGTYHGVEDDTVLRLLLQFHLRLHVVHDLNILVQMREVVESIGAREKDIVDGGDSFRYDTPVYEQVGESASKHVD